MAARSRPGVSKLDQMVAAAAVVGGAEGASFAWTQQPPLPKPTPFAATATGSGAPMLTPMRPLAVPVGGHAADTRTAGAQLMSLVRMPARPCMHPAGMMQSHPAES